MYRALHTVYRALHTVYSTRQTYKVLNRKSKPAETFSRSMLPIKVGWWNRGYALPHYYWAQHGAQQHCQLQRTDAPCMQAAGRDDANASYPTTPCHCNPNSIPRLHTCKLKTVTTLPIRSLPFGCHRNLNCTATYTSPRLCIHKLLVVTMIRSTQPRARASQG